MDPKQVELADPQAQKMNHSGSLDTNDWRSKSPKDPLFIKKSDENDSALSSHASLLVFGMSQPKSKPTSEEISFGERLKLLEVTVVSLQDEVVSLRDENESLRDEVETR